MRRFNFTAASTIALAAAFIGAGSASADQFPASGAKATQGVVFGAANMGEDSTYAVVGVVHAINGDIGKSGFLVHVAAELLSYDYINGGGTLFDADGWGGSAMAGYQFVFSGSSKIALYAGVGHRDIDVDPVDIFSETAGEHTSFKAQAEGYFGIGQTCDLSGIFSYLDNAEAYYGRVRAGFHLGGITVGPEVSAHGSDEYDSQEYGGFIRYKATDSVVLGARGGWADRDDTRGDDGGYFGVEVALGY
jgi:hypothetical protein